MFDKIIDPVNNKEYDINTQQGKLLLKRLVKQFYGGMSKDECKELKPKDCGVNEKDTNKKFRKCSLELHPDKNKDKDAQQAFVNLSKWKESCNKKDSNILNILNDYLILIFQIDILCKQEYEKFKNHKEPLLRVHAVRQLGFMIKLEKIFRNILFGNEIFKNVKINQRKLNLIGTIAYNKIKEKMIKKKRIEHLIKKLKSSKEGTNERNEAIFRGLMVLNNPNVILLDYNYEQTGGSNPPAVQYTYSGDSKAEGTRVYSPYHKELVLVTPERKMTRTTLTFSNILELADLLKEVKRFDKSIIRRAGMFFFKSEPHLKTLEDAIYDYVDQQLQSIKEAQEFTAAEKQEHLGNLTKIRQAQLKLKRKINVPNLLIKFKEIESRLDDTSDRQRMKELIGSNFSPNLLRGILSNMVLIDSKSKKSFITRMKGSYKITVPGKIYGTTTKSYSLGHTLPTNCIDETTGMFSRDNPTIKCQRLAWKALTEGLTKEAANIDPYTLMDESDREWVIEMMKIATHRGFRHPQLNTLLNKPNNVQRLSDELQCNAIVQSYSTGVGIKNQLETMLGLGMNRDQIISTVLFCKNIEVVRESLIDLSIMDQAKEELSANLKENPYENLKFQRDILDNQKLSQSMVTVKKCMVEKNSLKSKSCQDSLKRLDKAYHVIYTNPVIKKGMVKIAKQLFYNEAQTVYFRESTDSKSMNAMVQDYSKRLNKAVDQIETEQSFSYVTEQYTRSFTKVGAGVLIGALDVVTETMGDATEKIAENAVGGPFVGILKGFKKVGDVADGEAVKGAVIATSIVIGAVSLVSWVAKKVGTAPFEWIASGYTKIKNAVSSKKKKEKKAQVEVEEKPQVQDPKPNSPVSSSDHETPKPELKTDSAVSSSKRDKKRRKKKKKKNKKKEKEKEKEKEKKAIDKWVRRCKGFNEAEHGALLDDLIDRIPEGGMPGIGNLKQLKEAVDYFKTQTGKGEIAILEAINQGDGNVQRIVQYLAREDTSGSQQQSDSEPQSDSE